MAEPHPPKNTRAPLEWLGKHVPADAFSAFLDQPATPFDYGDRGYTACSNIGGEILEVTAPSDLCGYVSVKGGYEDSMDSLLARAQRPLGGKATFSLKIPENDNNGPSSDLLSLGRPKDCGYLNHRWPFTRYWLQTGGNETTGHDGICTVFSFVKYETVYQMMRLEVFQPSADESSPIPPNMVEDAPEHTANVVVTIGGPVRFSCRCTGLAQYKPIAKWNEETKCVEITAASLPKCAFLMKLRVNDQEVTIPVPTQPESHQKAGTGETAEDTPWQAKMKEWEERYVDISFTETIRISSKTPTIIMAAFKLHRAQEDAVATIPEISPEKVDEIAGIDHRSSYASAFMWKEFFKNNLIVDDDPNPSLYYEPEIGLVARCLERVLSAHYIPIGENKSSNENGVVIWPHVPGVAPNWEQVFWQVRFLVKVHKQLRDRQMRPHPDEEEIPALNYYVNETSRHILKAVKYVIAAMQGNPAKWWKPTSENDTKHHELKRYPTADYQLQFGRYYPAMTLCYVLENIDGEILADLKKITVAQPGASALVRALILEGDNHLSTGSSINFAIHKWFHYQSVVNITKSIWYDKVPEDAKDAVANSTDKVKRWRVSFDRAMAARISSGNDYTREDEECYRLIFIAKELGILPTPHSERHSKLEAIALKMIRARTWTTTIHPGPSGSMTGRKSAPASHTPWEIHSLCHHGVLLQQHMDQGISGFERYRGQIRKFLSADGSIIESWERSTADLLAGWFSLEPTCVIASTLLDVLSDIQANHGESLPRTPLLSAQDSTAEPTTLNKSMRSTLHDFGERLSGAVENQLSKVAQHLPRAAPKKRGSLDNYDQRREPADELRDLVATFRTLNGIPPPVNWDMYRHVGKYHPESFFASLDDSPQKFMPSATRKVELRPRIRRFIRDPRPPNWNLGSIEKSVPAHALAKTSIIDLKNPAYLHCRKNSNPVITGRISPDNVINPELLNVSCVRSIQSPARLKEFKIRLYCAFLDGVFKRNREFTLDPEDLVQFKCLKATYGFLLRDAEEIRKAKADLHAKLLDKLCDSLVDGQIQCRFFFIQDWPWSLVQAFAYMWHPHLLDGFDEHFRPCSGFAKSTLPQWISRITLLYWEIIPVAFFDATEDEQETLHAPGENWPKTTWANAAFWSYLPNVFKANTGKDLRGIIFPPHNLGKMGTKNRVRLRYQPQVDEKDRLFERGRHVISSEPEATTIVMSTNELGDFAKCSIISKVIPECTMAEFSETASEIWSIFATQPQTTRCLLFLVLLGLTCEELSKRYETIVATVEDDLRFKKGMLEDNFEWTHSPEVIIKLKQYLWALRTFQVFQNTLTEAIDVISEAELEMTTQISQAPGKRHETMEQKVQSHIDDFRKQFGRLITVSNKLQQRIEYLSKFCDGISSISTLEDGRIGISQDSSLKILTWITIGYLPLSFVAALFAVPETQNAVADELGLGWFIGALILFFVFTVALASVLGFLLDMLSFGRDWLKAHVTRRWRSLRAWAVTSSEESHKPDGLLATNVGVCPHELDS